MDIVLINMFDLYADVNRANFEDPGLQVLILHVLAHVLGSFVFAFVAKEMTTEIVQSVVLNEKNGNEGMATQALYYNTDDFVNASSVPEFAKHMEFAVIVTVVGPVHVHKCAFACEFVRVFALVQKCY